MSDNYVQCPDCPALYDSTIHSECPACAIVHLRPAEERARDRIVRAFCTLPTEARKRLLGTLGRLV